jgi:recombination associated protein RdgC
MFFRSLAVYRLATTSPMSILEQLAELSTNTLQPCPASSPISLGWISPRDNDELVHIVNGQILICLGIEEKILPAAVVRAEADKKAKAIEEAEGRRVGRKELRDLREALTIELLAKALTRSRRTYAWIDPINCTLSIDAGNSNKADELLEVLHKTCELPIELLRTTSSPSAAMTSWIAAGEIDGPFTIDQDLTLRAAEGAQVKYSKHSLEGAEIRNQIAEGKVVTQLAMTWADRISFVLNEKQQIKRLSFLDIMKEENDGQADNEDERFDLDFALMAGELAKLINDVIKSLGGEVQKCE